MTTIKQVSSESDFGVTGGFVPQGTYMVINDVALTAQLSFSSGCTLIFEGGRLSATAPVSVVGNDTALIAPMHCIFSGQIAVSGTWKISDAYPEWFETNVDAAIPINATLKMLKAYGGVLHLNGAYTINSPIIVPPHINLLGTNPIGTKIVLKEKPGVNADNYQKFEVDDDRWIIKREIGCAIDKQTTLKLNKYLRAAIYFQSRGLTSETNVGCGARNINVKMNGCACHGIYVERAYDQSVWENLMVEQVHHSFNAFRFTVPYEVQDGQNDGFDRFTTVSDEEPSQETLNTWNDAEKGRCGQTLLIMNCWGIQNPYQTGDNNFLTSPESLPGQVIAPTYYFHNQQETNVIGCKASANQTGTYKVDGVERTVEDYGGTCFHLEGCRGVTMTGCSLGGCNIGIAITAKKRASMGISIIGLTSEGVAHLDIMAQGSKYLKTNNNGTTSIQTLHPIWQLFVTPIRHETSKGNIYLEECLMSDVKVSSNTQKVYIMTACYMLNVTSVSPVINVPKVLDFNPAIQPITGTPNKMPRGCSNTTYSNANLDAGTRFLERISVVGDQDSNGSSSSESPEVKDALSLQVADHTGKVFLHGSQKVKMTASETLLLNTSSFKVVNGTTSGKVMASLNTPSQSGYTSLSLQVKDLNGNKSVYPVMLGAPDGNGKCQLYIQL